MAVADLNAVPQLLQLPHQLLLLRPLAIASIRPLNKLESRGISSGESPINMSL
jgi:hypothetical protein